MENTKDIRSMKFIRFKVNEILKKIFKEEEIERATLYEGAITRFIMENIKEEIIIDDQSLGNVIKLYYQTLTTDNPSIRVYLLLQRFVRSNGSEITSHLERKYDESKKVLLFNHDLFDVEETDADSMLAQIMAAYEDKGALMRAYSRICEKCRKFGASADRVVLAEIKKLTDSYETIVALRSNNVYQVSETAHTFLH
jgi:hypothetical protein